MSDPPMPLLASQSLIYMCEHDSVLDKRQLCKFVTLDLQANLSKPSMNGFSYLFQ
jgi:hypothetical protein